MGAGLAPAPFYVTASSSIICMKRLITVMQIIDKMLVIRAKWCYYSIYAMKQYIARYLYKMWCTALVSLPFKKRLRDRFIGIGKRG